MAQTEKMRLGGKGLLEVLRHPSVQHYDAPMWRGWIPASLRTCSITLVDLGIVQRTAVQVDSFSEWI
jgi:hypothetical protein